MERFAQRGNELLGMRPQKSFENSQSTRYNSSDMDFDDVFGGPPRRYSMQEVKMRYSFCEPLEEEKSEDNNQENSTSFDQWSGLIEKPVFGEESVNRRRYVNDGFFDDIFKGDENCSSPRKSDYHGSNPGSQILSPARTLPPKAEPFSTSLPSQFSLSSELTKASDSLGLASEHGITNRNEDAKSNGTSSPVLSKSSFSKFLNRAMWGKLESKGDKYRQSPLSREASLGNLESLDGLSVDNKKDITYKKNSEDVESPLDGSQFHFSIHNWAHGEVPLLIPLREGKTSKVEEKSDRGESRSTQTESLTIEIKKDDERGNQDRLDLKEVAKEENLDISDLKSENVIEHHAVDGKTKLSYYSYEESQQSHHVDKGHHMKEAPSPIQPPEPALRPLGVLFSERVEEREVNRKDSAERVPEVRKGAKSANFTNEEKKIDAKKKSSKKTVVSKISSPGSPRTSGDISHKSGVKGKVRDFVKIFSPETTERPKVSSNNQSQSSRWTGRENYGMDGEVEFTNMATEEVEIKTDEMPNAFSRTDENSLDDEVKQPSPPKVSNHSGSGYTEQKAPPSFSETFSFKGTDASSETYFRGSFSVEELSNDQDKDLQPSGDADYIKVSDAKIKQWSQGRKGNIRSLLSTLQLVLWPESGWKPVPLMNIIEGSGVKKAYQRALLCLHPDKLQQKGAAPHQKYIAEKVFDILQEAWDHFNSLGAI